MKTIIAIWNASAKGKSSTVLILDNLLISKFPNLKIIESSKGKNTESIDFYSIFEINGNTIALISQGDPGTHLEERLNNSIQKHNPNLIFCTCRTRGETVAAINKIAKTYTYNKIWTSTYEVTQNHIQANVLKAEHLLDLAIKMKLI